MLIDCSLYHNETDMLRLRLDALADSVDRFVVVAGNFTFTGKKNDLSIDRSLSRDYPLDWVMVEDMPTLATPWQRESFQRDAVLRGLRNIPDSARVMVSDVDEIPDNIPDSILPGTLHYFEQQFHYYTFNHRIRGTWRGTRACLLSDLKRWTPQGVRSRGNIAVKNGGWHFSYFGGVEKIREKLAAFSHTEYNTAEYNTAAAIEKRMNAGVDLFDRPQVIEFVEGLEHLPACVQHDPERYLHFFGEREYA